PSASPPFFSLIVRPPRSPLLPYTTLFRSLTALQPHGDVLPDTIALPDPWQQYHRYPTYVSQSENSPATNVSPRRDQASAQRLTRSEEHTSELQSRENLVCRLLPEKKKIMN